MLVLRRPCVAVATATVECVCVCMPTCVYMCHSVDKNMCIYAERERETQRKRERERESERAREREKESKENTQTKRRITTFVCAPVFTFVLPCPLLRRAGCLASFPLVYLKPKPQTLTPNPDKQRLRQKPYGPFGG